MCPAEWRRAKLMELTYKCPGPRPCVPGCLVQIVHRDIILRPPSDDDNPLPLDSVQESVAVNEDFPNGRIIQFGNDPAALGQSRQSGRRVQSALENLQRGLTRVLRDVRDRFVECGVRGFSPDYWTDPCSHLRRSSKATCSWESVRPASASATPCVAVCRTYKWYSTSSRLQSSGSLSRRARTVSLAVTAPRLQEGDPSIRPRSTTANFRDASAAGQQANVAA